jgi:hypothetical protein
MKGHIMFVTALTGRPEAPAGPPKLAPAELRAVQAQTLDAPRMHYGLLARLLFRPPTWPMALSRAS